ncbi:hypothetical protein PGT21_001447 [Puccinia graminis f. sp. tritici]|uniref:Uncharacterized protein n=1 Tax=Puccinia graminis f. sp. tritici TaxID=56615 RepID=A0A5B0Q1R8_PUCGR|nr:hypothetical protein PGT21_001447 [Puccinia graminis f. sp. tritici]
MPIPHSSMIFCFLMLTRFGAICMYYPLSRLIHNPLGDFPSYLSPEQQNLLRGRAWGKINDEEWAEAQNMQIRKLGFFPEDLDPVNKEWLYGKIYPPSFRHVSPYEVDRNLGSLSPRGYRNSDRMSREFRMGIDPENSSQGFDESYQHRYLHDSNSFFFGDASHKRYSESSLKEVVRNKNDPSELTLDQLDKKGWRFPKGLAHQSQFDKMPVLMDLKKALQAMREFHRRGAHTEGSTVSSSIKGNKLKGNWDHLDHDMGKLEIWENAHKDKRTRFESGTTEIIPPCKITLEETWDYIYKALQVTHFLPQDEKGHLFFANLQILLADALEIGTKQEQKTSFAQRFAANLRPLLAQPQFPRLLSEASGREILRPMDRLSKWLKQNAELEFSNCEEKSTHTDKIPQAIPSVLVQS